jgi:hypothetical protein
MPVQNLVTTDIVTRFLSKNMEAVLDMLLAVLH